MLDNNNQNSVPQSSEKIPALSLPSNNTLYRVESGEVGIYEAVEKDCPRNDPKRRVKPDGGWLPKVGPYFPGSISYWTARGLQKYIESHLLDWHHSVVRSQVSIIESKLTKAPEYSDEWQVISNQDNFEIQSSNPISTFFEKIGRENIIDKVGIFVTRSNPEPELLVFKHTKYPDLGIQFPAGTVEPRESSKEAAKRELEEESGLKCTKYSLIDTNTFFKNYSKQFQRRFTYHTHLSTPTPDTWKQIVNFGESDCGLEFEYSWQPLSNLDPEILKIEGVGLSLFKLQAQFEKIKFRNAQPS